MSLIWWRERTSEQASEKIQASTHILTGSHLVVVVAVAVGVVLVVAAAVATVAWFTFLFCMLYAVCLSYAATYMAQAERKNETE